MYFELRSTLEKAARKIIVEKGAPLVCRAVQDLLAAAGRYGPSPCADEHAPAVLNTLGHLYRDSDSDKAAINCIKHWLDTMQDATRRDQAEPP